MALKGLFKSKPAASIEETAGITTETNGKRFKGLKYWLAIAEWLIVFVRAAIDFIRNLEPFPKKADYYD